MRAGIAPRRRPVSRPVRAIRCALSRARIVRESSYAEINQARSVILVQAYSFTSMPIAKALVSAKQRGVSVEVILDKSQRSERYSGATFLANAGIRTLIDEQPSIAHSKVIIIDGTSVITGSFNFTRSAQQYNAENLIVIRDGVLAQHYTENWVTRERLSSVY